MPLIVHNPDWRREMTADLSEDKQAAYPALAVWHFLEGCVITPDGWTFAVTKQFIAVHLATSRAVVNEAIARLTETGIVIGSRPDESGKKRDVGRPGLCYQIAGVSYYTKDSYPQRPVDSPQGNTIMEFRTPGERLLNLVAAVESLTSGEFRDLLMTLLSKQQQDSNGVPPPNTIPGQRSVEERKQDNNVPSGYVIAPNGRGQEDSAPNSVPLANGNPELWSAREQKYHWLTIAGVVEPTLSELVTRQDVEPAVVLAWAMASVRQAGDKHIVNPVGVMVKQLRAGTPPPADLEAYARWLYDDHWPEDGAGWSLTRYLHEAEHPESEFRRRRYISGEYADYIES